MLSRTFEAVNCVVVVLDVTILSVVHVISVSESTRMFTQHLAAN